MGKMVIQILAAVAEAERERILERTSDGIAAMTQVEEYFAKAEPVLEKAGAAASECLSNMRDTIEELRQETAQNPIK